VLNLSPVAAILILEGLTDFVVAEITVPFMFKPPCAYLDAYLLLLEFIGSLVLLLIISS